MRAGAGERTFIGAHGDIGDNRLGIHKNPNRLTARPMVSLSRLRLAILLLVVVMAPAAAAETLSAVG
ncbi:MAG: hypothetical protein MZW92_45975 [Comamonadaceae bacterium]|nr:hypothetical protein [Comamonadaceae bacterium]